MLKIKLIRTFLVIFLYLGPCVSLADDFISISFLNKQIGSFQIQEAASDDNIIIRIDGKIFSSPFAMFNGRLEYKSIVSKMNKAASKMHYESTVDTALKKRKVNYWVKSGRLIAVDVFPKTEKTEFSNPKHIDFEFIDPAYAITKLLSGPCKNSFIIYDGRRVVDVTAIKPASKLDCRYVYKILKGPGHLSPFNFKKFEISTFFDQNENSAVRSMIVKSGPFKLILNKAP